ncbi:hypothetical protein ACLBKS_03200 [Hylemonella sp. W303a]|uniref:hypothetical protein n=1 Tax=Hylemonella sp. W303a TaxID=3389873 RepID=UPI00396B39CB
MNEDEFTQKAREIYSNNRSYTAARNAGNEEGMRHFGQLLGINEDRHMSRSPDSSSTSNSELRAALAPLIPQREMNQGTPVSSPRSSITRMPPVDIANSHKRDQKPAWNYSTRVEQPLSATATGLNTRENSTKLTGKIGSKHWN